MPRSKAPKRSLPYHSLPSPAPLLPPSSQPDPSLTPSSYPLLNLKMSNTAYRTRCRSALSSLTTTFALNSYTLHCYNDISLITPGESLLITCSDAAYAFFYVNARLDTSRWVKRGPKKSTIWTLHSQPTGAEVPVEFVGCEAKLWEK